tara:strand:- start:2963 stop:3139 length:177 start_codon:yes stop_codon:yes gene_type:complete
MNARKKKAALNSKKRALKGDKYVTEVKPWDPDWKPSNLSQAWIKDAYMRKQKRNENIR